MKMNKTISVAAAIAAFALAPSCRLDEPLISTTDRKTIFSTEGGIESYAFSLYSGLPSLDDVFYKEDACVDYCMATSWSTFYLDGAYDPEKTTSWSWTGLRRVSYFLDALQSEDCTVAKDVKEHYLGLGKWFRAYFYYGKLTSYGEVPWFEHLLSSTDEKEMYRNRDSRDYVVSHMLADLDYAYEHLKTTSSVGNSKISKYAALLLKARVCLFEASWRKYHNLSGELYTVEELYSLAEDAAKKIMDSGKFSIHTAAGSKGAYRSLWYSTDIQTDEVILGLCTDPDYGIYNSANYHFNSGSYGNGNCMSRAFAFTYLNTDGTPFTSKPSYSTTSFNKEFTGRDLRLAQTVKSPNYQMTSGTSSDLIPDIIHLVAATGYHIIKFSLDDVKYNNTSKNINSMPLMRYAEALLIYAEAKAELGTITDVDWKNTIGKLRQRAGITGGINNLPAAVDPYLQQTFYPTVTNPVILEIRRERAIELFFEGFRNTDVKRWAEGHLFEDLPWTGIHITDLDVAVDVNSNGKEDFYFSMKPISEIPSSHRNSYVQILPEDSTEQGLRAIPNPEGGYDLEFRLALKRIWYPDDRQYLTPVPPQIIREYKAKGYELSQNPGW